MLRASGLYSGYDGVTVVKGVDLEVENEIFAVLGANGAGKTTLLATLARLIPLMDGELAFEGEVVSEVPAWETAARGLGYVPQESGVFADPVVTEISPARPFYEAEAYHQDYYRQNPHQSYCRFVIAPKLAKLGME